MINGSAHEDDLNNNLVVQTNAYAPQPLPRYVLASTTSFVFVRLLQLKSFRVMFDLSNGSSMLQVSQSKRFAFAARQIDNVDAFTLL